MDINQMIIEPVHRPVLTIIFLDFEYVSKSTALQLITQICNRKSWDALHNQRSNVIREVTTEQEFQNQN